MIKQALLIADSDQLSSPLNIWASYRRAQDTSPWKKGRKLLLGSLHPTKKITCSFVAVDAGNYEKIIFDLFSFRIRFPK